MNVPDDKLSLSFSSVLFSIVECHSSPRMLSSPTWSLKPKLFQKEVFKMHFNLLVFNTSAFVFLFFPPENLLPGISLEPFGKLGLFQHIRMKLSVIVVIINSSQII